MEVHSSEHDNDDKDEAESHDGNTGPAVAETSEASDQEFLCARLRLSRRLVSLNARLAHLVGLMRNAHFDLFDEGSVKPCLHGASSFVSWGGDKASKGMDRRYTNFEPSMLRHCKRFPNCNVYAVDASWI
jgi:hypothetical protein